MRTFTNVHTGESFTEEEVIERAIRSADELRKRADEAEAFARMVEDGSVSEDNDFLDLTNGGLDEHNPPFVAMDEDE